MAGYFTHVERTYCLGEADPNTRRIYDVCVKSFERAMEVFAPGKSITGCMKEAERGVRDAGLDICEMGFHGHGMGSMDLPRYRLHALKADVGAVATLNDRFGEGMVFAFNIDLVDPAWRGGQTGAVFGETVLITKTGARRLHNFSTDFQRIG
jgi:Xaa-Pro aminopeptidase